MPDQFNEAGFHSILLVANGQEAVDMALKHPPDQGTGCYFKTHYRRKHRQQPVREPWLRLFIPVLK
jgi:hypothetical protein